MARGTLCALVLALAAGVVAADEVWLKNDCVIEGAILRDRPDHVLIQTAGGKMTIPRDQIARIVLRKAADPGPPPSTNGRETPPQPPKEEPQPPKEQPKPPKEEPKPPRDGEGTPQPPKVVVEPKTPSQHELITLLERRAGSELSDEDRARMDERIGDLMSQDLEFAFRVFDAGPMNRSLQLLGIWAARKDPMVLPLLEARLASDNPSTRSAIVSVLGLFEGEEHIARLRGRLANEAPAVQVAILELFERKEHVAATEEIVPLLVSPSETVRNRALAALKRFASVRSTEEGPYDLGQLLATLYADQDTGPLSMAILRLLSDIGGMSAIDTLRAALASEDAAEREEAARGLGRLAARAATLDILALAEEDAERPVRLAAIKALELIKDPAATERLIALMDTEDAEILSAVHRTLKVITNQSIGKSYDEWAAWWASQR